MSIVPVGVRLKCDYCGHSPEGVYQNEEHALEAVWKLGWHRRYAGYLKPDHLICKWCYKIDSAGEKEGEGA